MNVWKCSSEACPVVAMGAGEPVGLVAIGWYVEEGQRLCPAHHPGGGSARADAVVRVLQPELLDSPVDVSRFLDACRGPVILVTPEEGHSPADVAQAIQGLRGVASAVDASGSWNGSWPMSREALARLQSATLGAVMAGWRVMYRFVPLVWTGGHAKLFEFPVKSPSLDAYDSLSAMFREAAEKLPKKDE